MSLGCHGESEGVQDLGGGVVGRTEDEGEGVLGGVHEVVEVST